ncbi:MAG: tRNA (adenosine(37)-N6)-threonylcarbamoyltransferase complex transferase subunit TsaD [Alphaproteobacteria bacterium]|nr:tRNA (adenosine(37)-N6)-threonylcarbamoyltransferase complex transferase subunit TsaD [Alphaproteobacteria bacterium]MCL2758584.1 tRNA (adenosine(37)-N6)-threonylcarbamoyltransferase complex transferase subunit TsaD [Alphaproteobacteria bacterium]
MAARKAPVLCLGIESSCDETSAALVDSDRNILSHVIYSQVPDHQKFGGVVPELAARGHILAFEEVVRRALEDAGKTIDDVDVIAATAGPGLIGGVLIGWLGAVGMAQASGKPLVAVNHLEGHALVPRLTNNTGFPFLLLLASGGHTQILLVRGVGDYEIIGQTLDDSAGECYDKVAKMLGLGYPGGPVIDARAAGGDPTKFKFPRPLCGSVTPAKAGAGCDFSFSGLKTSARTIIGANNHLPLRSDEFINDFCASFQAAVVDCMENRMRNAMKDGRIAKAKPTALVVAGGVAKNSAIRAMLERLATEYDLQYAAPPLSLCTDNGAMIAWAGIENFRLGRIVKEPVAPRPRWPLTEL